MKRRTFMTTSAAGALIAMPLGEALSKAVPAKTIDLDISDGLVPSDEDQIKRFSFFYNSVTAPYEYKENYFDLVKFHNARVNHFVDLSKKLAPVEGFQLIKAKLVRHPDYFSDVSQCLFRVNKELLKRKELSFIDPKFLATTYSHYYKTHPLKFSQLHIDEELHKDYLIKYDDVLV